MGCNFSKSDKAIVLESFEGPLSRDKYRHENENRIPQTANTTPPKRNSATSIQYDEFFISDVDDDASFLEHHPARTSISIHSSIGGSYGIRYAHVSQRGYYPDSPNKANQDSCIIVPKFCEDCDSIMFAVFDGHGEKGDQCSKYAAKHLPEEISRLACKSRVPWKDMVEKEVLSVLNEAHINVNNKLRKSKVDDSLSGTTAISVILKGELLIVNNVGDSRAILCHEMDGRLVVKPLSVDQTPFRQDERERCKAAGARVMTMDQLDGLEPMHENWDINLGEEVDEIGDPPRIWLQNHDRPGCAFTRSIGDGDAEAVGVIPVPEQLVREIGSNDRFMIIASDGVFEFLTSKAVQDIVAKFDDPLEAAVYVVQESYKLWLQYEVRTDDITIIVVFFDSIDIPAEQSLMQLRMMRDVSITSLGRSSRCFSSECSKEIGMRPVRRYFSKEAKNMMIQENEPDQNSEHQDITENDHFPKSEEQLARITCALSKVSLFCQLSPTQIDRIAREMKLEDFCSGSVVIRQGEDGVKFYLLDSGIYSICVSNENDYTVEKSVVSEAGYYFGELSLMYGKPRAATVTCLKNGQLWTLDKNEFREILMERMIHDDLIKALRKVGMFSKLTTSQLQPLCESMTMQEFKAGSCVNCNDCLYVVNSGEILCHSTKKNKFKEINIIGRNGIFGENTFFEDKFKEISFVARSDVHLLCLSRLDVDAILGMQPNLPRIKIANNDEKLQLEGAKSSDFTFNRWAVPLGNYGFIMTMTHCRFERSYSVKVITKNKAVKRGQIKPLENEISVLQSLKYWSPFVPIIIGSFDDSCCISTIFEAIISCSLEAILTKKNTLSEQGCQWICACIISGISHIHKEGIVHRNISMESVYITSEGYAQLSDFRYAINMEGSCNNTEFESSPSDVTEESIGQHLFNQDFWALGALTFDLIHGQVALKPKSLIGSICPKKLRESTLLSLELSADSSNISTEVRSLINEHLSCRDFQAIFKHNFYKGINWTELHRANARPPTELLNMMNMLDVDPCSEKSENFEME